MVSSGNVSSLKAVVLKHELKLSNSSLCFNILMDNSNMRQWLTRNVHLQPQLTTWRHSLGQKMMYETLVVCKPRKENVIIFRISIK